MPAFDNLQRASFAGIAFPVEEITIDGGLRDHVHEYPHSPGGAPEKLGRRLYTFRMRAKFHATFRAYGFTDLYPRAWNRLRNICEAGRTEDLVVPTLGTLKAYAVSWPETATARQRSGVTVEFTFREDVDTYFMNGLLSISSASMEQAQQRLAYMATVYEQTPPGQVILEAIPTDPVNAPLVPPPDAAKQNVLDLLGAIDAAFNLLLSIDDQADFYATLAEIKVMRVISLCQEVARRAELQDARNARLREALLGAWSTADDRRRDIEKKREQMILYITPIDMSVTDVAKAVYGDASRAMEILKLNALRNPFLIPRGSALRMYKPGVKAAA
jgi:hypothetical protein